jgi:hypothetical protein
VVAALFGKTLDGVRRDVAQHLDNVEHERARAAVTQDENAERQDTCT